MALISGRFNLLAGAAKRKSETPGDRAAKLPKAGDISIEQGPRPAQAPRRLPASAPVDVCMYRITDVAGDLWELFRDKEDLPLYQVQVSHQAQRSVCWSLRDSFNDFLRAAHSANNTMPATLQQLEAAAGVRLVVTDRADPEDVGFVQWRAGFYCVDLNNFLVLLDSFWKFKERQLARDQPFEVTLHPHKGIDVSAIWDILQYEHYALQEASDNLPLHVFDCQPVAGKRITVMNIQIESSTTFSIVLTGHTWPWRGRLDAFGVSGGYYTDEAQKENEPRKYYRVWKQIDVSEEAERQKCRDMLGDAVFKNLAMRVTVDKPPERESDVAEFIDELRNRPALFFTPTPQPEVKADDEEEETQRPEV